MLTLTPALTLTTQGANVNTQTKSQMTALQLTVAINDPALCAESLVKAGADTSLKNEEGYTALDYAKQSNNMEAIRLLENAPAITAAAAGVSSLPFTEAAPPFTSPLPPSPPLLLVAPEVSQEMSSEISPEISTPPEISPPPETSLEASISPEMSSQMLWLKGELQVHGMDSPVVSPSPSSSASPVVDSSPETQGPSKRFGRPRLLLAVPCMEAQLTAFEI